jgi:RNA polymerase sigma-70 factor (ECF subfamily)
MSSPQTPAAIQTLFEAARTGEAPALEKLLEQVRPQVLSTCYRMIGNLEDAEDAAQDALLAIVEELKDTLLPSAWQTLVFGQAVSASLDFINLLRDEDEQNNPNVQVVRGVEPLLTGKMALEEIEALEQNDSRTMTTRASMMLVFVHVLHILPVETRAVYLLKDVLGCSDEAVTLALGFSSEKIAKHLRQGREVIAAARAKIPEDNIPPQDARAQNLVRRLGRRLIQKDAMKVAATLAEDAVLVIPKLGSFHGQEAVAVQFVNMFTVGLAPDAIAVVEINGQPGLVCLQQRLVRKRLRYLPCLILALAIPARGAARNKIVRLDMVTEAKVMEKIGRHAASLQVRALRPRR